LGFASITSIFPGSNLKTERPVICGSPGKALPRQNAEFHFCHVQPGSMSGCKVEPQAAMEAARHAGAAAVALSGAGPSLIAFSSKLEPGIGAAMQRAFESAGLTARIFELGTSYEGAEVSII
jgi:hypothetical protein